MIISDMLYLVHKNNWNKEFLNTLFERKIDKVV